MSYDITIRSDASYSRSEGRASLESFMAQLPGLRRADGPQFVLDDRPKRWLEISLESVDANGNSVEEDPPCDTTNCIRLHIPYAFLGRRPDRDYFPTAFAIADHLGWSLYDEQSGEIIPREATAAPMIEASRPWWKIW